MHDPRGLPPPLLPFIARFVCLARACMRTLALRQSHARALLARRPGKEDDRLAG